MARTKEHGGEAHDFGGEGRTGDRLQPLQMLRLKIRFDQHRRHFPGFLEGMGV